MSECGRAGTLGVILVLALLVIGGVAWWSGTRPAPPASPIELDVGPPLRGEREPIDARDAGAAELEAPEVRAEAVLEPAPTAEPARTGRLIGTVALDGSEPFPMQWRLRLEAEDGRRGEHAFHQGERAFDLPLDLGTWTIRAESDGLASRSVRRSASDGAPIEPVELVLAAVGTLEVPIEDAQGAPVADVLVIADAGGLDPASHAATDALGTARVEGLRDGAQRVYVGDREHPLLAPIEIVFRGPLQRLEPVRLPPLGRLEVRVLDAAGAPVADAEVTGSGQQGGRIEVTTGLDGRCVATRLPAGLYRVFARHPAHGRGDRAIELAGGASAEIEVRLRR